MTSLALLVDRRGSRLSLGNHHTLVIQPPDGQAERVGIDALSEVILVGDVDLDSRVLLALSTAGVPVACIPLRGAHGAALVSAGPAHGAHLRHAQHRACANDTRRLALARITLRHKLTSIAEAESEWGLGDGHVPDAALESTEALNALLGLEGAATRAHFDNLRRMVPETLGFRTRQRRPPRDPVNALLSLGYTLAQSSALRLLMEVGLDPSLGFTHREHRDRPALALDLIEPARAHVDSFCVRLLSRGELDRSSFSIHEKLGVRLNEAGRRAFFPAWFRDGCTATTRAMRSLLAEWREQLTQDTGNTDPQDGSNQSHQESHP